MRRMWLISITACAMLADTACASTTQPWDATTPTSLQINGTVVLGSTNMSDTAPSSVSVIRNGDSCTGNGEFPGVAQGTIVLVQDQTGANLANSKLGAGLIYDPGNTGQLRLASCVFGFTLTVPADVDETKYVINIVNASPVQNMGENEVFTPQQAARGVTMPFGLQNAQS